MIKRQEAKVVYSIDAKNAKDKDAEITVEFDAVENRITFLEKGKPLFYVSACDADSLAKKFKEINKAYGYDGSTTIHIRNLAMPSYADFTGISRVTTEDEE